jgi:hypothetical protein
MLIQGINAVLNLNVQIAPDSPYVLEDTKIDFIIIKPDSKTVETIPAELVNAAEGRARVFLSPENLSEGGIYKYQLVVTFADNTVSKSAINAFYVADSIMPPAEAGESLG